MNQREKLLGIGIGATVLIVGGIWVISSVSSAFETRQEQRASLEKERNHQIRAIQAGDRAKKRLQDLQAVSLPGDETLASSLYAQWLLKQSVAAGFTSPNVTPGSKRPLPGVYDNLSFLVDGQGDLREVSEFLSAFYRVGYLHRIRLLRLTPTTGSRDLKITMTVEALSLKGTPNPQKLTPPVDADFAGKPLDAYVESIINRNMFSSGNQPPRIASPGSQKGNPTRVMSFTVKATDPDEGDNLSYRFEGTPLEGATIDSKSGEIRWTPPKVGEYELAVQVSDDGLPVRSSVERIKVVVADPPPVVAETPKPKKLDFDPAHHAFLSAILQSDGKWQIWVTVRTEGKVLRFEEGDKISVGSVEATLKSIRSNEAELAFEDGRSEIVRIGKTLASEG